MNQKSITSSKFAMIIDSIDIILVNENPLYSIFIHETSARDANCTATVYPCSI